MRVRYLNISRHNHPSAVRRVACLSRWGRVRSPGQGFTIIELLIALAITGFIGAAIAAMLFTAARGTSDNYSQRELLIRQKVLDSRVSATLRSGYQLLAAGNDYVVLWMGDARANIKPNISELCRLEYDSENKRLLAYQGEFPQGWSEVQLEAADIDYDLTSDFNTITTGLKSGSYFPVEVWLTGISGMTFTKNHNDPKLATLVSYQATLESTLLNQTTIGAVAIRGWYLDRGFHCYLAEEETEPEEEGASTPRRKWRNILDLILDAFD